MYSADLLSDQCTEKAVQRRQSTETARKARVFNTRQRVIGVDVDALNKQVQEKRHQQNVDKQRDKTYDMLRKRQDEAILQRDMDEKEKRECLQKELAKYWAAQQLVDDSQKAHLDSDLKGAFDLTIPENHLGPSSMKVFQGENIGEKETRREQIRQNEKDLRAQMNDDKTRHLRDKHRELQMNKELLHQDLQGVQQAAQEEEEKKAARIMLSNFNKVMATEQAEKLKEQHRREERENLAEKYHIMTSDMMTECADAAEKDVGGGRPPQILTDRWKGMRPEQLKLIYREQDQQRYEKERKLDAAKVSAAAWDIMHLKLSKEAEENEKRTEALRREQRTQMDKFNKELAEEQQKHQEYLNKKLYTNKPTKDYFNQFSTSSR